MTRRRSSTSNTAAVALVVEVLLLQLTRRLQDNARDMLNFKRQREQLIERLELAKSLAEETAEQGGRGQPRQVEVPRHHEP